MKKLNITSSIGAVNKVKTIKELAQKNDYNLKKLYVGNVLNDFQVMKLCGLIVRPADSHQKKDLSDIVLKSKGRNGVIRE